MLKANETYTGPSSNPLMQIKYDKLEIDYDYVKDDEDNGIHTVFHSFCFVLKTLFSDGSNSVGFHRPIVGKSFEKTSVDDNAVGFR